MRYGERRGFLHESTLLDMSVSLDLNDTKFADHSKPNSALGKTSVIMEGTRRVSRACDHTQFMVRFKFRFLYDLPRVLIPGYS